MRSAIFIGTVLFSSICGASEWIPHVPYTRSVVQETIPPPVVQYQYVAPQVYYQWVPYTVSQPVVLERRCLLFKRTVVEYVPATQWVYQPVIIR